MFVILALFFLWQGWTQFRDRSPIVEIGPAGLRLPSASSEPIAWPRIWHAQAGRGLPGFGGGRVDFMVDAETFARLKLGQRFMGELIVKKRSVPNAFSVITPQLDESANAIFAAVKRYWPPDRGDDNQDDDEEQEERRADARDDDRRQPAQARLARGAADSSGRRGGSTATGSPRASATRCCACAEASRRTPASTSSPTASSRASISCTASSRRSTASTSSTRRRIGIRNNRYEAEVPIVTGPVTRAAPGASARRCASCARTRRSS